MNDKQKTIKKSIHLKGAGLHTGVSVNLSIHPADIDHGIVFKIISENGSVLIPADANLVKDTSRGTSLEKDGQRIATVEHLLSALYGLGIDNALIEVDNEETPILDGSSKPYVDAILKSGILEQNAKKDYFVLKDIIRYSKPENGVEMIALPSDTFRVSVMIDYGTRVLGTQNAVLDNLDDYVSEISPSRTFVFLHELEPLIKHNLIKGGDLDNAIVFVDKIISDEELKRLGQFFKRPNVEVLSEGILNNIKLNFANEPARHKLLDVIGDLALTQLPIKAHIIACKPGHQSNVEFAKLIKKQFCEEKGWQAPPEYDPNATPLYDINQIKKMLPHRPPFLLVDKIIEMTKTRVVGVKNVSMNESFFVGHFPDDPVMPGVLQIESMAQAGGILMLSQVPDPENYTTLFLKIENSKFRHKVVPGDTLVYKLELASPIRRGICHMKGLAFVGKKVVMEAELLAQVVKTK